jgi:uncharacterized protein
MPCHRFFGHTSVPVISGFKVKRLRSATLLVLPLIVFCLATHEASSQSLLWRLDVPASSAPSWLFGTMHARCADDVVVSNSLRGVLDSVDVLALELNMSDPELPLTLAKYAFMPRDSTLRTLLSPGEYDTLSAYLRDSISMMIPNVETMRPLFLIGMLMGKVLRCTPVSYEERLMSLAKVQGKEVLGIETPEEQFDAFNTIPLREQARMVLDMIRSMDKAREEFLRLDAAYARADLDEIVRLARENEAQYGRYDEALLVERNYRWIPRIIEAAEAGPTLFAVGAGHLPGAEGVIELLRDVGVTVTPVIEVEDETFTR